MEKRGGKEDIYRYIYSHIHIHSPDQKHPAANVPVSFSVSPLSVHEAGLLKIFLASSPKGFPPALPIIGCDCACACSCVCEG